MIETEWLCSGQGAALAGGTTMVIDFALPVDGDIAKGFRRYQEVTKRSVMDYGLHMAVTTWNEKVPCCRACSVYVAAFCTCKLFTLLHFC